MSILQEYQKHVKYVGRDKLSAVFEYVKENDLSYSDVIYNKTSWEEFDKWYDAVYNNRDGKSTVGDKKI